MSDFISTLINQCESSIFRKENYSTQIDFNDFPESLSTWTDRNLCKKFDNGLIELKDLADTLLDNVPAWQRDNDKWSEEMQISFLINCLNGFTISPLTLYYFKNKRDCNILDGLQRITAFYKFFTGKFIFDFNGKKVSNIELLEDPKFRLFIRRISVNIQIIKFNNEIEAIDYYIAVNENISHSSIDILRAKKYRIKLLDLK